MNPAFSVIFFTTASGAGYGLIALFGIGAMLGLLPDDRWFGGVSLGVALALVSAGVLLYGLLHLWGPALPLAGEAALVAGLIALTLKRLYWNFIDRTQAESTPETATGLGHLGKVRLFEAPHTESNYLLKEMGFKVGRKHAAKLRRIALIAGFYIPILLTMLALTSAGQSVAVASSLLSVLSIAIGIVAERWLFFAEAKHTVMLYYGAERV